METEKKKRGKAVGTYKYDEMLCHNLNIRVSEGELARLDKHASALNVPRSDIFRGFIHSLPEAAPKPTDGVPVVVGKTPMLLSRAEAKKLLRDLTVQLVA